MKQVRKEAEGGNYHTDLRASKYALEEFLKGKKMPKYVIGVGTSGPKTLIEELQDKTSIEYWRLGFPTPSAHGHAGILHHGRLMGVPVIVLQGRVHYFEGYSLNEVTLMVRTLLLLGIKNFIFTNASGSMKPPRENWFWKMIDFFTGKQRYDTGDLILVKDHVNNLGDNPLRGVNIPDLGKGFTDMSNAYDRKWQKMCVDVATHMNFKIKTNAVYTAVPGPVFETPAEVRKYAEEADLVGMSTIPEVTVAAQGGARVMVISLATNIAAGLSSEVVSHEENLEVSQNKDVLFSKLISRFVRDANFSDSFK